MGRRLFWAAVVLALLLLALAGAVVRALGRLPSSTRPPLPWPS